MKRKASGIVIAAGIMTACLCMSGCGSSGASGNSSAEGTESNSKTSDCSFNKEYDQNSMITITGTEADLSAYDVFSEAGFAFQYPDEWNQLNNSDNLNAGIINEYGWLAYYIPTDKMEAVKALPDDVSDEEKNEVYMEAQEAEIPICAICRVNISDDVTRQFKEAFGDDFPEKEELCTIGKNTYYFMYNETFEKDALTDEDAEDVQALIDALKEFRESLVLFPPCES